MMSNEAKAERAAYQKQWRAAHKDKVKEYNARYWARKAAARRETEANINDQHRV